MKLVTAAQMQHLDRRTIQEAGIPGIVLMERAGKGVVSNIEKTCGNLKGRTVTVFCGKGNNGGDGFVIARLLRRKRIPVHTVIMASPSDLKGDARTMYQRLIKTASSSSLYIMPSIKVIRGLLEKSELVVDALLGTGISSEVKGPYRLAIETINHVGVSTVAVDIPSGINADSGDIMGVGIGANLTVTFGLPKLGLFLGKAIDHIGELRVVDIGIPQEFVDDLDITRTLLRVENIHEFLPKRPPSSHKGTLGHAGIIAGSPGKTGSAALAARACLRVGTGLVTVATPSSVNGTLEAKLLEAMTVPVHETEDQTVSQQARPTLEAFITHRDAVGIGPGLTTHPDTVELVRSLIPKFDRPCVIDADALNAIAGNCELFHSCRVTPVITPHPGEMARLIGHSSAAIVNHDRLGVALKFARDYGVIVVLKGARTLITDPRGHVAICPTGNPGMATAGMGDVLTGVIAGLLSQGLTPWDAARVGVYVHGLAGDIAAERLGQSGMIASDVIEALPHALMKVQKS